MKQSTLLHITRAATVKCTASEALVETLVRHKVKNVFGIVGSAFIDPLDLFPAAGIDFVDVTHVRYHHCYLKRANSQAMSSLIYNNIYIE